MESTNSFDLDLGDLLEVNRIYDPDLDDSIEEVYELIRDHNEITITAELNHLLSHV
jgi:hypothetical protein